METNVKAIETVYHGYRFRSRLEARWAVYFDTCGWDWEYELEGYDLNGTYYLPDFMLHDVWDYSAHRWDGQPGYVGDLAVEIKGVMTEEDYEKVRLYQKYIGPILVLGNIPNGNDMEEIFTDIWMNHKSNNSNSKLRCYFYRPQTHECTKCNIGCYLGGWKEEDRKQRESYRGESLPSNICPCVLHIQSRVIIPYIYSNTPMLIDPSFAAEKYIYESISPKTLEAFTAARQARFEHGETPKAPETSETPKALGSFVALKKFMENIK